MVFLIDCHRRKSVKSHQISVAQVVRHLTVRVCAMTYMDDHHCTWSLPRPEARWQAEPLLFEVEV